MNQGELVDAIAAKAYVAKKEIAISPIHRLSRDNQHSPHTEVCSSATTIGVLLNLAQAFPWLDVDRPCYST